jgi:hypothetical protein
VRVDERSGATENGAVALSTQPGSIGDLHDANLNVVQGLLGRTMAVVTVDPPAVWLIQGR